MPSQVAGSSRSSSSGSAHIDMHGDAYAVARDGGLVEQLCGLGIARRLDIAAALEQTLRFRARVDHSLPGAAVDQRLAP